jgi:sugar O-acyltransferase (sialic acid O-acetyltransferase NeuD family)
MKKPVYIYGAGGLGREVLSFITSTDEWTPAGFIDDNAPKNKIISGISVLGGVDVISEIESPVNIILAFGDPLIKQKVVKSIPRPVQFVTLIHPSVIIQDPRSVQIGEGSIICAGSILTTDISVGNHVLINLNCTIGHDVEIGDHGSVMPGVNVAGGVIIGSSVLIGAGANIINNIRIGQCCRIGMGAVVINNVDDGLTVVGIPAKPISL